MSSHSIHAEFQINILIVEGPQMSFGVNKNVDKHIQGIYQRELRSSLLVTVDLVYKNIVMVKLHEQKIITSKL